MAPNAAVAAARAADRIKHKLRSLEALTTYETYKNEAAETACRGTNMARAHAAMLRHLDAMEDAHIAYMRPDLRRKSGGGRGPSRGEPQSFNSLTFSVAFSKTEVM